jgi:hypothetical protein
MLQPGEPVMLMGPTGAPTDITGNETVVLCGGGLGNAVLFSIGAAFRAAGSKVLYFAGYKKVSTATRSPRSSGRRRGGLVLRRANPASRRGRPQDRSFVGNIVQAMDAYAEGCSGSARSASMTPTASSPSAPTA